MRALIAFLLILNSLAATSQEIQWLTLEEVQKKVADEPKKVFVDIVADWCKWCKVMEKETFSDASVQSYIHANYYAVRLEYEGKEMVDFQGVRNTPKEIAASWGVQDLPTIVFWDDGFEQKSLARGYQDAGQFLETLKFFNEF